MKRLIFSLSLFAILLHSLSAKTVYVNCQMSSYDGHDGSTPELALETIQDGIDKLSTTGDTVYVAPGVYNKGKGKAVETWGPSRIGWNNRGYNIIATSTNPADTVIVGERSSDTPEGYGAGGMRCISVYNGVGTVVKGFKLRDGHSESTAVKVATGRPSDQCCQGGAVRVDCQNFTLADCVIEGCSADDYGAAYCGTYVRCRFTKCTNKVGARLVSGSGAGEAECVKMYCCVVDNNYNSEEYTEGGIMIYRTHAYNCTFVNCFYGSCCYSAGEKFYNCIFWNVGTLDSRSTYANCITDVQEPRPILSTIHADVRLLPGSKAIASGDSRHLADFALSEQAAQVVSLKDFGGNDLPSQGAIAAGATQTICIPAAGAIASAGNGTCVDGYRVKGGSVLYGYAFPDTFPTQYVFTVAGVGAGKRVAYFKFMQNYMATYDYRYPDMNDRLCVMPPADPSVTISNYVTSVQSVCYLKPDADASVADGSEYKPYRTFKDAIAEFGANRVYVAKKGIYREGVVENVTYGKARMLLSETIRVTSEEGAGNTFIVGERDTSADADEYGRGPNSVRAVICDNNMSQVQGFTLTGCYSDKSGSGKKARGGASVGNNYMHIDDCIVTNNCGGEGGAIFGGWSARTYIANNHATDYIVSSIRCCGCVIEKNTLEHSNNGIVGSDSWIVHTDILGEHTADAHPWGNSKSIRRYASVFQHGDTARNVGEAVGNVYWDFMMVADTVGGLVVDPLLTDPANGDWHPFVRSPVFTCGVRPGFNNYGADYCCYATTDFEGNPIAFYGGKPVAGAFMHPTSKTMVAIDAAKGGVSVSQTRFLIEEGGSLTVDAGVGARPCVGVTVNGVTNEFPVTITAVETVGGAVVSAIYTDTWYVDATHGNDGNTGFTAKTAKRTLAAALAPSLIAAGDTVFAAEGLYDAGTMKADASEEIESRVVVTNDVKLIASGARERTIIQGAVAKTTDAYTYESTDDMRGMGRAAVRCVLLRRGATIRGFTVSGGFTRGINSVAECDKSGGGIAAFGEDAHGGGRCDSYAEDCIITNCAAHRGGGVFAVKCTRCVFVDNLAVYGGGATSDAYLYGSLSKDNKVHFPYSAAHSGHLWNFLMDGCTVMDGIVTAGGGNRPRLLNSVVSGMSDLTTARGEDVLSCVIAGTVGIGVFSGEWIAAAVGTVVTNVDAIALDEHGVPSIPASPAIDAADVSLSTYALTDKDAWFGQRVYNGAMDIGAVESDWRPVYARDIRKGHFVVEVATPNVIDRGEGIVTLTDRSTLSAVWLNPQQKECRREIMMRVKGNGVLKVKLNGELVKEVTCETLDSSYSFDNALTSNRLDFDYVPGENDAGWAEILRARSIIGFGVIIR